MNMNLLLECNWQVLIDKLLDLCYCLIGVVTFLISLYLLLKYWINPYIKYCHEKEMKVLAFNNEMIWDLHKRENDSSDEEEGENQ